MIERNTALQVGNIITADGVANTGFVFRENVVPHNAYGIFGSGTGVGTPSLARYCPGAVVTDNVIAGGSAGQYPAGNFFPRSLDGVGFVDRARGDYRLAGSSPYKRRGADGKGPGADFDALTAVLALGREPSLPPSSSHLTKGGA